MTVGVPQSFPPYYGLDEDGNPAGFAVDVMDAVAERAGFEVSYSVAKTGGDNFEALLAGRIDIIPSLGISEKRARQVAFTAPVETFHVSLFVRGDTQDIRGLDDLAGRKVAVIADNVARRLLAPRDDIALRVFPLFADALFALLAGRVDALAYPEPVTWKLAREARVADQLKVVGRPLFEIKRAMAVRKDNVELLALLDLAVAEFVASPEYRGIYVAWFGKPSPFWTLTRAAWAMGILFALSLIAMAGWRYRFVTKLNGQLERRVQERTAELRSAVAALRESEERFRDLAESASDWFWEFGADLRVTYVSDRMREVTGVEPSSIIGVHVRDLPTVNREDSDWSAYIDALEERRPFRDLVFQRRVDDGSIRYFQVSGRPAFDGAGGFLGFRCTTTDVTARVRAEEALRRARDELEQRVEQRTAEIQEANESLKGEITERKLAEQALRESEEKFRTVVDHSPTKIHIKDLEGRYLLVNKEAEDLFGVSDEEARGRTSLEIFSKEQAEAFRRHDAVVLEANHAIEAEEEWLRDDGVHTFLTVKFPIRDASGKPVAIGAIGTDITERKRAEERLQMSEDRLQRSVLDAPIPIMIHAEDGEVLMISKKWAELSGYFPADIPTILDWTEKAYGADREHMKDLIGGLYEIEEPFEDEACVTTASGERRTWDFRTAPLGRLPDGRRFVISMAVDITERKIADQALRESEDRLQRSVLDAPIPIMIHAEDGEVLMINQEWTSLTGYTHAEIPTIPVWTELAYGSRGIADQVRERIGSLYGIEEKTSEGDYHITTKAGEPRIWDFRSSPLGKLPDGRRFVISMAMDVTERRIAHDELERRVEERTAELRAAQVDLLRQERLATLGQLTATVSHELRNPLGVIRTSTFVARDGLNGATPRVRRALARIDRSVIRCDRIIDELLDFTRISGLEPEPTPIDAWLDGTLKEQALPAEITLRRDFGLAGTTVPFDRDRFRRAIINVFDNACQAMTGEAGREAADADNAVLSVTTKRKNGRVEVIFEDRGPGIPADVLPRIFEPLFSTKGFGVGLGLPVVKQIMEQHGGGIEIDGTGESGTRVCLWLPAERPTQPRT